ncbi:MAG: 16S rRNA (guanine(966)-N(2))-methyltransferase RsmD [Candidatus Nanopelagicaceae bacterium]
MRIIAGVAKGRNLASVQGAIRPTSDRAREALFSTLQSEFGEFENLKFLDLFAGSAAVGLEALSRGASLVHAVEKDEAAQKTIRANQEILEKAKAAGKFHLYAMSAQKFLANAAEQYDIIFIDPPYEFSDQAVHELLDLILKNNFIKKGGVIVIERATKGSHVNWPAPLRELRTKEYGVATLYYGEMG